MGDEISKKDLQALQANVNKQIAEVKKQIETLQSNFNKDLEEENKITVRARTDLEKRMDGIDTQTASLQNAINTLARAISDVASKVQK